MMATMNQKGGDIIDKKTIIVTMVCSLVISPITFQLTKSRADSIQLGLLASVIITLTLFVISFYLIQNILIKNRCPPETPSISGYKPFRNIFNVFYKDDNNNSNVIGDKQPRARKKIDPKYFKPKYIYHELMSIWGTTYTVITWGSVYIIGGTLVATERLANKIKMKCTREHQQDLLDSNRGTGRNSSFASYSSSFSSTESITSSRSTKSSFKRISSWTKRSYSAVRKRFNKFIGAGVLQITESSASAAETTETSHSR